jgi:hypothetical protein
MVWGAKEDEMKDMTPKKARCSIGACPAVYADGDNLIIIGTAASDDVLRKLIDNGYPLPADGELAIVIERDLLANVLDLTPQPK